MAGIRLDSGDLAYLSIEARRMLDEAGFGDAVIVASNDLDEQIITSLKQQGARINVWGVGTRLATAYDQPALGGVYKLTMIRHPGSGWEYKLKLSEQSGKITNPGRLQVRRFERRGEYVGDAIYDEELGPGRDSEIVDPQDGTRRKRMPAGTTYEDLLVPVFRQGRRVYDPPPLSDVRRRAGGQLERFHPGIKRFLYPHAYPVGLEPRLHELKTRLIVEARARKERERAR